MAMRRVSTVLLVLVLVGCAVSVGACGSPGSLFPITEGGKAGYIDASGQVVIEPQFYQADVFSEGLARVTTDDEKVGYIDKAGAYVIQPQFYDAGPFSEGLAAAQEEADGDRGYIDTSGSYVIDPQPFWLAREFSDGLALVTVEDPDDWGDWGYIDKTGTMLIAPQFCCAESFSEGLAPTQKDLDDLFGYIDKTGTYVIQPQFDYAGMFSEGLAPARIGDEFGYIDKTGSYVIEPQFGWSEPFSEGLAGITSDDSHLMGYIDTTGELVIQPQYVYAGPFVNGLAHVVIKEEGLGGEDGLVAYIDKTGKVIWQGESYNRALPDEDGMGDEPTDETDSGQATATMTTLGEQEMLELTAPAWGVSASELEVEVSEDFGEWVAAAIFDEQAGRQVVFRWTGSEWQLFWLQKMVMTDDGMVEFEDPVVLIPQGVLQDVIDWLNLDM